MTIASRSDLLRKRSESVTPSTSEYSPRKCFKRASFTSQTAFRLQFGNPLKLRTRSGPQYPQPTTPTETVRLIFYSPCCSCPPVIQTVERFSGAILPSELHGSRPFARSKQGSFSR